MENEKLIRLPIDAAPSLLSGFLLLTAAALNWKLGWPLLAIGAVVIVVGSFALAALDYKWPAVLVVWLVLCAVAVALLVPLGSVLGALGVGTLFSSVAFVFWLGIAAILREFFG